MAKKKEHNDRSIAKNRKAFHDYFIEETFEAGVVLTGCEVRSLRDNHCQLTDCFVLIRRGEAWLHNVHIAAYKNGTLFNTDPDRTRKLLLHKRQIRMLERKVSERGYTLVPLSLYFSDKGLVKCELGLARGKKDYDKRATMAERDTNREIQRELKERYH